MNKKKLRVLLIYRLLKRRSQEISQRQKKRYWMHSLYKKGQLEGEFHTIRKELEADATKFQSYYRMSPVSYAQLLKKVDETTTVKNFYSRASISVDEELTVTLRYLATGDSFVSLSFRFRMAPTTISLIIGRICTTIWNVLALEYMPVPDSEKWSSIAEEMWNYRQFPNCIGCVDGKHIRVQKPSKGGSLYYNYKSFHSVILLAIVNASYEFVFIDVGIYGHNCDRTIFKQSNFGRKLMDETLNIPEPKAYPGSSIVGPYCVISDEGFPLHRNVMRPYPMCKNMPTDQKVFNYRLSRARLNVECAFGMLRSKFRIFDRPIATSPKKIDIVVMAACILHNYVRINDRPQVNEKLILEELRNRGSISNISASSMQNASSTEARQIRKNLTSFFMSPVRELSWQYNKVEYN